MTRLGSFLDSHLLLGRRGNRGHVGLRPRRPGLLPDSPKRPPPRIFLCPTMCVVAMGVAPQLRLPGPHWSAGEGCVCHHPAIRTALSFLLLVRAPRNPGGSFGLLNSSTVWGSVSPPCSPLPGSGQALQPRPSSRGAGRRPFPARRVHRPAADLRPGPSGHSLHSDPPPEGSACSSLAAGAAGPQCLGHS